MEIPPDLIVPDIYEHVNSCVNDILNQIVFEEETEVDLHGMGNEEDGAMGEEDGGTFEVVSDSEECQIIETPPKICQLIELDDHEETKIIAVERAERAPSRPSSEEFLLNDECVLCHRKFFSDEAWVKHAATESHLKKLAVYDTLNGDSFDLPSPSVFSSLIPVLLKDKQKIIGEDHMYEFHRMLDDKMEEFMYIWACDCCYVAGPNYSTALKHTLSDTHRLNIIEQYHPNLKPRVDITELKGLTISLDKICAQLQTSNVNPLVLLLKPGEEDKVRISCLGNVASTTPAEDSLASLVLEWIINGKKLEVTDAATNVVSPNRPPSDDIIIEQELPKCYRSVPTKDKSTLIFCDVCRDCFTPSLLHGSALEAVELHRKEKSHQDNLNLKRRFQLDEQQYVNVNCEPQIQHDSAKITRPVGLEYIIERHLTSKSSKSKTPHKVVVDLMCRLCCKKFALNEFASHIKSVDHIKKYIMTKYRSECEPLFKEGDRKVEEEMLTAMVEKHRPARQRVRVFYPRLAAFYADFVKNNLSAFAGGSKIQPEKLKKDHLLDKGLLDTLRAILESKHSLLSHSRREQLEVYNYLKESKVKLVGADHVIQVQFSSNVPEPLRPTYFCPLCIRWTNASRLTGHLNSTTHKVRYLKAENKRRSILGIEVCEPIKALSLETEGQLNARKTERSKKVDKLVSIVAERYAEIACPKKQLLYEVDATLIKKLWPEGCQRKIIPSIMELPMIKPPPGHFRDNSSEHTSKSTKTRGSSPPISHVRVDRSNPKSSAERVRSSGERRKSPTNERRNRPRPKEHRGGHSRSRSRPPVKRTSRVDDDRRIIVTVDQGMSNRDRDRDRRSRRGSKERRSRGRDSRDRGSSRRVPPDPHTTLYNDNEWDSMCNKFLDKTAHSSALSKYESDNSSKDGRKRRSSRSPGRRSQSKTTYIQDRRRRSRSRSSRRRRSRSHTPVVSMPIPSNFGWYKDMDMPNVDSFHPMVYDAAHAPAPQLAANPSRFKAGNWRKPGEMESTNYTYSPTKPATRNLEDNLKSLLSADKQTTPSEALLIKLLIAEKEKQEEAKKTQDVMMSLLAGLTATPSHSDPSPKHAAVDSSSVYDYRHGSRANYSAVQMTRDDGYRCQDVDNECELVRDAAVNVLRSQRSAAALNSHSQLPSSSTLATSSAAPEQSTPSDLTALMAALQKYGIRGAPPVTSRPHP